MFVNNAVHHYLDPAHDLHGSIDNVFDLFYKGTSKNTGNFPPVNIWSNDESVILMAELPGCKSNDFDISCKGNIVTLAMAQTEETAKNPYHLPFKRVFELPYQINEEKTEAVYRDGLLQIVMPRAEQDKPRKIAIKG